MPSREIKPREVAHKNVTDSRKREGLPISFDKKHLGEWEILRQQREKRDKENGEGQLKHQKEFKNTQEFKDDISRRIDEAIRTNQNGQNPRESLETLAAAQKIAHLMELTNRGRQLTQTDLQRISQKQGELTQQVELTEVIRQQAATKPTFDSRPKTLQEILANSQNRETENKSQKGIQQLLDELRQKSKQELSKLKSPEEQKKQLDKELEQRYKQEKEQERIKATEKARHQVLATDNTNSNNKSDTDKKSDDKGDSNSNDLQSQRGRLQTQLAEASAANLPTDTVQQADQLDQAKN